MLRGFWDTGDSERESLENTMQEMIEQLQEKLKDKLPEKRYLHTVGVRYTAEALAMRYGVSLEQAGTAGVLHDCAKYLSGDKMLERCRKFHIPISESEEKNPSLLHAKLGVYYARNRYYIEDKDVLSAIRWHTTGKEDMTTLEKIVFLADYIEPHRKVIPGLDQIRRIAFLDLDQAVYLTLKGTIDYLQEKSADQINPKVFDPKTMEAFEYYQNTENEQKERKQI